MPEQTAQTIRLIGALGAGVICGLAPLVFGWKRYRLGFAMVGFFACVLAGYLFGILLAAPVAILFSAAILRRPIPTSDRFPLPTFSGSIFVLMLVLDATGVVLLLTQMDGTVELLLAGDTEIPNELRNQVNMLLVADWVIAVFATIVNALLVLRYRFAVWLGYLVVAAEITSIYLLYTFMDNPLAAQLPVVQLVGGPSTLMKGEVVHGVLLGLYVLALILFHRQQRKKRDDSGPPAKVPKWMSEPMFTSSGQH